MNTNNPFHLVLDEDKKTSESIYFQIRHMILSGELEPGSRLPSERKLADMLQRSRAVVREALQMLEREGYILKIPKSSGALVQLPGMAPVVESFGNFITTQNLNIEEILEFRQITETYGARLAAHRRTSEQLSLLYEIVHETELAIDSPQVLVNCDLRFHMAIAECSGNAMFVIMLNICKSILDEKLTENILRGTKAEQHNRCLNISNTHKLIVDAIANQQGNLAYNLMKSHLEDAERDLFTSNPL